MFGKLPVETTGPEIEKAIAPNADAGAENRLAKKSHAPRATDWWLGTTTRWFTNKRCADCGVVSMIPQIDDETLAKAYPQSYQPHAGRAGLLYRIFDPLLQGEAVRLTRLADPRRPLVDVGCGGGDFLGRLRRAGWSGRLSGVEPGSAAAERVRQTLQIDVAEAGLHNAVLPSASAGTIVLRHVIEHVRDPEAGIARVAAALEPGGCAYVATPNIRALGARAFGRFWCGSDPPRHLHCFTDGALRAMLGRHGLVPIAEFHDFSPHLALLSLRQALGRAERPRWAALAAARYCPPAAAIALVGGLAEVALRRASQYGVIARRVQ